MCKCVFHYYHYYYYRKTPYALRPSAHHRIIPRADNKFCRIFITYLHALRTLNFSMFFVDIVDIVKFMYTLTMAIYLYLELSIFMFFYVIRLCLSNVSIKNLLTYLLQILGNTLHWPRTHASCTVGMTKVNKLAVQIELFKVFMSFP